MLYVNSLIELKRCTNKCIAVSRTKKKKSVLSDSVSKLQHIRCWEDSAVSEGGQVVISRPQKGMQLESGLL